MNYEVKKYDNGAEECIFSNGMRRVKYNTGDIVEFNPQGKVTYIYTTDGYEYDALLEDIPSWE